MFIFRYRGIIPRRFPQHMTESEFHDDSDDVTQRIVLLFLPSSLMGPCGKIIRKMALGRFKFWLAFPKFSNRVYKHYLLPKLDADVVSVIITGARFP